MLRSEVKHRVSKHGAATVAVLVLQDAGFAGSSRMRAGMVR
jgi:hypothetical protein